MVHLGETFFPETKVNKALKTRKRAPKMAESRNLGRAVVKSKQIESK